MAVCVYLRWFCVTAFPSKGAMVTLKSKGQEDFDLASRLLLPIGDAADMVLRAVLLAFMISNRYCEHRFGIGFAGYRVRVSEC